MLADVLKRRTNFRERTPSALRVRAMYEKLPKKILMLMERMCTLCPVIVTMLENQPPFYIMVHYSLPTLRAQSEFRD